jgi:hypothetical protein
MRTSNTPHRPPYLLRQFVADVFVVGKEMQVIRPVVDRDCGNHRQNHNAVNLKCLG